MMRYKRYYLFLMIIILLLNFTSCEKKAAETDDPDIIYLEKGPSAAVQFNVTPKSKKMTLEIVDDEYLSSIVRDLIYPPHWCHRLFNYDYTYKDEVYYDLYIFDIDGYDNLKLYAYLTKSFCYNGNKNDSSLIQTLIVDESKKDMNIEFDVGDSIEKVKEYYPDIHILSSLLITDDVANGGEYIEILNKSGMYTYFLDDDTITGKVKIDLRETMNFHTLYPIPYYESDYKLCYDNGKYYLEKQE